MGQAQSPIALDVPARPLRLGVLRRYFCDRLDRDVRNRFEEAIEAARASGATVDEVEIPHAEWISAVYLHIVFADAASYHAATLDRMPGRYTPQVRLRLEAARYVLAEDYVRALDGRRVLQAEVNRALTGRDALLLPSLPIPAPTIGAERIEIGGTAEPVRNLMLRLTQLFNLTGHPAVSIPCGRTPAGLPVGLQLVGPHDHTRDLLGVARAIEQVLRAN